VRERDTELEAVPFTFPPLAGRSVFVLGLGGGCDVITALAVSTMLDGSAARVVYGNTKTDDIGPVERLTPHIGRVDSPPPVPGRKQRGCGRAALDHSVPRDRHGSPWIVQLADEVAEQELAGEIASLGFDLLVGVDAGGDSIASKRGRGHRGRDQRILGVLRKTGVPVLHVVVAPGCDGESTADDLGRAMALHVAAGRYRGCFALAPLLPVLRSLSGGLSEMRTPRIMLAAADGLLHRDGDRVIVPRGCKPAVPAVWLTTAYVFAPERPSPPDPA
jgi:hypothetical protein